MGGCSSSSLLRVSYFNVLSTPFRILHLFLLYTLLSKKIPKIIMHDLKQRVQSCDATHLPPPHWTGVFLNPVFCLTSSTYQKHLKRGQCIEIDDSRSLSKFGDVMWPSLHFTYRSVFHRPAFYRMVCKIVNLYNINLKFLGSISDVNIDNCAKFC